MINFYDYHYNQSLFPYTVLIDSVKLGKNFSLRKKKSEFLSPFKLVVGFSILGIKL